MISQGMRQPERYGEEDIAKTFLKGLKK